jgi:hypothetical protein
MFLLTKAKKTYFLLGSIMDLKGEYIYIYIKGLGKKKNGEIVL